MSTKHKFPMTHDQIGELVAFENEDPNGWDDDFHENAVAIIEQLLMEIAEAPSVAPCIVDEIIPFADAERETVLQDTHYKLGPYAQYHQNWIRRMDATVRQREEVIAQLKQPCPDCDNGKVASTGGYSPGCLKCDGSGRRIVSEMLEERNAFARKCNQETGRANRQLDRIRKGLLSVGMKVIEDEESKIVVMLCPPESPKL